jgi:hypothetical protein
MLIALRDECARRLAGDMRGMSLRATCDAIDALLDAGHLEIVTDGDSLSVVPSIPQASP